MEVINTSETVSQIILSQRELWSWVIEYVYYMDSHNQVSNITELVESLLDPGQPTYMQILHSMLRVMAKYGFPENFPEDGSIFNQTQPVKCNNSRPNADDERILDDSKYWLEGVSQATVGIIGILGNIFAMKIFLTGGTKFNTIFYRLLVSLLFTQTFYVCFSLGIFLGQYHENVLFFNKMFANGLYPVPSLLLHTSTILTMLIAWHRFKATDAPLDYLVTWKFVNATRSALKSLAVSIVIGFVLVIPLFFEPTLEANSEIDMKQLNTTHVLLVS